MTVVPTSAPMVGRSGELHQLEAALAAAPGTLLIGGEAGVGKTRFTREFAARAAATGARVLVGGCLEIGADGLPYAPFTTILRVLARDIGIDGVSALLPPSASGGLARLLPEFGEPETDTASGEQRARLFELVLTLLERLAEDAPTVLVIEDAHWADRSTRDLLTFLIRNVGAAALLILITYRSDELHREHPLRPLLAELDRVDRVRRVELARLSRAEVGELARNILGRQPEDALVDRIHARSEGNPLFVETLLDRDGELAGTLPESLRDLLLAGVQRLPEETQETLRLASVPGARIDHALLAAVTGLDDAGLTRVLRPAVAGNVLVVDGDGYAFRHGLIQEAIHDDLLPGEHTGLHARYARAMEADPALVPAGRLWAELAHHWFSAHDVTWALVSAWRAAEAAGGALAYAECLTMLSRVLELWERVPGAADHIAAGRLDVLEKAVAAAELAGEFERGIKLATVALRELAAAAGADPAGGDPADGDPVADRFPADVRRAELLEMRGRMTYELARPESLDDLRAAVDCLPVDPPSLARARALASLAKHGLQLTGAEQSRAAATESLQIAREVEDAAAEADALLTLFCLDVDYDGEMAAAIEAEEIARRSGSDRLLLRAYVNQSHFLEGAGRHAEAVEVAGRGIELATRLGMGRTHGTFLAINTAEPLVSLGRWDEAMTILRRALDQKPAATIRVSLHVLTGEVALARGDLAAAESRLALAREVVWQKSQDFLAVTRLATALRLAQGRPAEALRQAAPVLSFPEVPDRARYSWPVLVLAAAACAEPGEQVMIDGRPAFPLLAERAAGLPAVGPLQRAQQLTFAAEGARVSGAPDFGAWDAAAAAWERIEQPYSLAGALGRAAEAAIAKGDRDIAAARLRRAAELARELATGPLLSRLEDLARRSRIRLADDPAAGGGAAAFGLTPRELEVLRLVAQGRSNREIAGELFISAKTASVHVSNILAKLHVSGRGAAAAAAHQLDLFA